MTPVFPKVSGRRFAVCFRLRACRLYIRQQSEQARVIFFKNMFKTFFAAQQKRFICNRHIIFLKIIAQIYMKNSIKKYFFQNPFRVK